MYIRFVVLRANTSTGVRDGVFTTANELRDGDGLSDWEFEEIRQLLAWFGEHLETPTRFNRTSSKGWYRRSARGISWLRTTAVEHVTKMRALVAILESHGHHVTVIKAANPGYIVYEDEHQVVAEPFRELRV